MIIMWFYKINDILLPHPLEISPYDLYTASLEADMMVSMNSSVFHSIKW